MTGFDDFQINRRILLSIEEMGWKEPTPIQTASVPSGLQGRDVLGQAQTGSGKTGAYGMVVLGRIRTGSDSPEGLVLVPTRELAEQVSQELGQMSRRMKHSIVPVYGGASISKQAQMLEEGADLVVGTPGRVMDLTGKGILDLSKVRELVLDEADRMLDMGFHDDIMEIISGLPEDRQTLMYSATLSDDVVEMASGVMRDPVRISVSEDVVPDTVSQYYVMTERKDKIHIVNDVIASGKKIIIFCSTKKMTDDLYERLSAQGMKVGAIHGDMPQFRRDKTVRGFRKGSMPVLVATDVAARGIDIDDIDVVVNYDSPYDPETYVHRIGRAGRAGRKGIAITLVTPMEDRRIPSYEAFTGMRIAKVDHRKVSLLLGSKGPEPEPVPEEEPAQERERTFTTVAIDLGKRDGVDRNAVIKIVMKEAGLKRDQIGNIGLSKDTCFVDIDSTKATKAIRKLCGVRFNGRELKAEVAPEKVKCRDKLR
jgi:ATP-dependent RNA helicase DeaD